jgi:DNA-binding PadR family transcriptional regulator
MTELECCVLGVVWHSGPLTAYEVAKPFAESQSSYWSGSAGSIYPLVKRLEEKGYLRGETASWNARMKRTFTITEEGLAELRSWLSPPFPDEAGAATFDPIRTRLSFLNALPKKMRAKFLDEAERVIRLQLAILTEHESSERARKDQLSALTALGAIFELEARLQWLAAVRAELLP